MLSISLLACLCGGDARSCRVTDGYGGRSCRRGAQRRPLLLWHARHTLMADFQVVGRGGSLGDHDSLPFASRGHTSHLVPRTSAALSLSLLRFGPGSLCLSLGTAKNKSLSTYFLLPDIFPQCYPAWARPYVLTNHRWLFFGYFFWGRFLFLPR